MKKNIIIGVACMAAGVSLASTITWSPSVQMYPGSTSESFVMNNGTNVLAFSGHSTAGTAFDLNGVDFTSVDGAGLNSGYTANGVTVSSSTSMGAAAAFGDGSFSSNGDIYNLLHGGLYGSTTVTLSGLTIGQEYQMQVFCNDSRSGRYSSWQTGFTDGVNSGSANITGTAGLSNRDPDTLEGESSGDYIIGTFTADVTGTQSFEIYGTSDDGSTWTNSSRAQLNGFSLQTIPEPATIGLVAMFGGSVLFIRRRFMM